MYIVLRNWLWRKSVSSSSDRFDSNRTWLRNESLSSNWSSAVENFTPPSYFAVTAGLSSGLGSSTLASGGGTTTGGVASTGWSVVVGGGAWSAGGGAGCASAGAVCAPPMR